MARYPRGDRRVRPDPTCGPDRPGTSGQRLARVEQAAGGPAEAGEVTLGAGRALIPMPSRGGSTPGASGAVAGRPEPAARRARRVRGPPAQRPHA